MKGDTKKDFSGRVTGLKLSAIKEVAAEVKRDTKIVSLAQGLPSFSTPEHIRKAAAEALLKDEKGIGAYSLYSGTKALKKAIVDKLEKEITSKTPYVRENGSNFRINSEREVFVTVGAMEGLAASILSIVGPGDEVVLPTPNYPPHITEVKLAGGVPKFVRLIRKVSSATNFFEVTNSALRCTSEPPASVPRQTSIDGSTSTSQPASSRRAGLRQPPPAKKLLPFETCMRWTWELKDVEKAITGKTKLIILTNPGNPTGCLFDYKLLKGIVKLAKNKNIWVLADETYSFLTYGNLPHAPLGIFRKEYDKLIVIRSFSKEYAMTGWRIGYVYAPEKLVTQALKAHDALIGCPSSISQKGALAALSGTQRVVGEFRKELAARRELVCRELDKLGEYFEYVKPQGAYYVWVRIRSRLAQIGKQKDAESISTRFALKLLRGARVAVVPGEAFGPGGENYFRVCFAASRGDIIEAFKRIKKFLTEKHMPIGI